MTVEKKLYKIRMECTSFHDVIVESESEEEAKKEACIHAYCPQNGMEFGEFLPVDKEDEITYQPLKVVLLYFPYYLFYISLFFIIHGGGG